MPQSIAYTINIRMTNVNQYASTQNSQEKNTNISFLVSTGGIQVKVGGKLELAIIIVLCRIWVVVYGIRVLTS